MTSAFKTSSIIGMSLNVKVFRIVVGGIQCVRRSYNFARTCRILAGECSSSISLATWLIKASQSGGGMGVLSVTFSLQNQGQSTAFVEREADLLLCMDSFKHK